MPYNQKKQPDGKCYRTVCNRKHDFQWNSSTEAYYCIGCRILITRYPENQNLFTDHRRGKEYPSKDDPELKYFVELVEGQVPSWMVVYQKEGFHGSEAHDDWFGNFWDADQIAQQLAKEGVVSL